MPTKSFAGLSEDKKRAIVDSALKEFSEKPYDRVSVFKIAQGAGISRASFYGYFRDKEDIYKYLIELMTERMRDISELPEKQVDVFEFFKDVFRRTLSDRDTGKWEKFVKMVFQNVKQSDNREFFDSVAGGGSLIEGVKRHKFEVFKRVCDFSDIKYTEPEDVKELEFILFSIVTSLLQRCFSGEISYEDAEKRLERNFEFVRHGVVVD